MPEQAAFGGEPDEPSAAGERSPPDWDGPLALLLEYARRGRIDLSRLSMEALVDQCLGEVDPGVSLEGRAEAIRDIAALTALKAKLLLPKRDADQPDSDFAAQLRRRLDHLAALRNAAAALMARPRLGRDRFPRGNPETAGDGDRMAGAADETEVLDLLALVRAYARLRLQAAPAVPLVIRQLLIMTLEDALAALRAQLPGAGDWRDFLGLVRAARPGSQGRDAASLFVAALELARRGEIEIRQQDAMGEIALRRTGADEKGRPIDKTVVFDERS